MRGLCDQWANSLAAYGCVMQALKTGALSYKEFDDSRPAFSLHTLARLVTLREIVRHGALANSAQR